MATTNFSWPNQNEPQQPLSSWPKPNEPQQSVSSWPNPNELPQPVSSWPNPNELPQPVSSWPNPNELPQPPSAWPNPNELPQPPSSWPSQSAPQQPFSSWPTPNEPQQPFGLPATLVAPVALPAQKPKSRTRGIIAWSLCVLAGGLAAGPPLANLADRGLASGIRWMATRAPGFLRPYLPRPLQEPGSLPHRSNVAVTGLAAPSSAARPTSRGVGAAHADTRDRGAAAGAERACGCRASQARRTRAPSDAGPAAP
jgi:hypothetical protein